MHYVLPMSPQSPARYSKTNWQGYLAANKRFADKVVEVLNADGDFVWVHDYHLMLLPTFLRKRFNTVRCGFFLHSPFPSSEIFRTFPNRDLVLRGLLNADVVGFHTFDYARHFLSCTTRLLGLNHKTKQGALAIDYYGRAVRPRSARRGVNVGPSTGGDLVARWRPCAPSLPGAFRGTQGVPRRRRLGHLQGHRAQAAGV